METINQEHEAISQLNLTEFNDFFGGAGFPFSLTSYKTQNSDTQIT